MSRPAELTLAAAVAAAGIAAMIWWPPLEDAAPLPDDSPVLPQNLCAGIHDEIFKQGGKCCTRALDRSVLDRRLRACKSLPMQSAMKTGRTGAQALLIVFHNQDLC